MRLQKFLRAAAAKAVLRTATPSPNPPPRFGAGEGVNARGIFGFRRPQSAAGRKNVFLPAYNNLSCQLSEALKLFLRTTESGIEFFVVVKLGDTGQACGVVAEEVAFGCTVYRTVGNGFAGERSIVSYDFRINSQGF